MAPHVDERRARAVGVADQIELFVAEGRPHLVEVVDRILGRVLGQVGRLAQPLPAGADALGGQEVVEEALDALHPGELGAVEARVKVCPMLKSSQKRPPRLSGEQVPALRRARSAQGWQEEAAARAGGSG